jgi:hypothetical protein
MDSSRHDSLMAHVDRDDSEVQVGLASPLFSARAVSSLEVRTDTEHKLGIRCGNYNGELDPEDRYRRRARGDDPQIGNFISGDLRAFSG